MANSKKTNYHLPPHSPKKHWLLGNLYYIGKDKLSYFQEHQKTLGDIHEIKNPFRRAFVTTNPDYIKHILQDNNRNYTKSFAYDRLRDILGNGLLTSEGDFWRRQRRLAQPAFHKERLNIMADIIVGLCQKMITNWEKNLTSNSLLNITMEMNQLAMDIVSNTLINSADIKKDVEPLSKAITAVLRFSSDRIDKAWLPPLWVPTPRNLREKSQLKMLDNLILSIIEGRRNSQVPHHDLLAMLMEATDEETGERMSNQQLRDEVMTLFLAGHETTAVAMGWTLLLLAQNPDKMEKLYAEIDEVLQGNAPTPEDLRKLVYTKQIIDESMRVFPPAWVVGRKSIEDDKLDDYDVPSGTNVIMPIYLVHQDEKIWENPTQFEPERFEPQNIKDKHRFAYFPFGGGPRLCIGNAFAIMEMQIALALLAQKYRFQLVENYDLQLELLITMRPKHPIMMYVHHR